MSDYIEASEQVNVSPDMSMMDVAEDESSLPDTVDRQRMSEFLSKAPGHEGYKSFNRKKEGNAIPEHGMKIQIG